MPCVICHRASRGFGFIAPGKSMAAAKACSMEHLDMLVNNYRRTGAVIDPNRDEKAAALAGLTAGWEYASSIGKTDLATFAPEEAEQFALCVIGGYTKALADSEEIPF